MRNRLRGGWTEWLLMLAAALLLTHALLFPLQYALSEGLTAEERQLQEAFQQQEIIRLHVVAHSDSPEDQALKLRVRDAVLERFGALLSTIGAQGFEQANALLKANVSQMQAVAEACARQHGFEGTVIAEAGKMFLHEKQYGQIMLPAGEYHALRITLGSGNGQNWWCVLYPQLCLALTDEADEPGEGLTWRSQRIWRQWLALPV